MKININFGGFYDTIHDDSCESAAANYYSCYNNALDYDYGIDYTKLDEVSPTTWQEVRQQYSIQYINLLNETLETSIVFLKVSSPRSYNFTTDSIIGNIERVDILKIFKYIKDNDLKAKVYERIVECSTSRDGYASFFNYSNYFEKVNLDLLTTILLDIVIENENNDYPLYIEELQLDL